MLQDILLPIFIVTFQSGPVAQKPQALQPQQIEAFTITYKSNGRRSPFIPPSEFTKTDDLDQRASQYLEKINKLKAGDLKTQLTHELDTIQKLSKDGDVKKALALATKGHNRLSNNSDEELQELKNQYSGLYKDLARQVKVLAAKEKLKSLNITINGILWAPSGQEAIVDGNNIVRPGEDYKGIKINAIEKDAIEFDINGIRLSQSLQ